MGRLKRELTEIRARGLSYDEAESSEDVHCVAAGVTTTPVTWWPAMSISVPTTRWDEEHRESLAALVRQGAARLSERLGLPAGGGPSPYARLGWLTRYRPAL